MCRMYGEGFGLPEVLYESSALFEEHRMRRLRLRHLQRQLPGANRCRQLTRGSSFRSKHECVDTLATRNSEQLRNPGRWRYGATLFLAEKRKLRGSHLRANPT